MTSTFFSKENFTKAKLITAAALIAFGITSRFFLQGMPNFETITVVSLLAGSLLGGVWTMVIGLIVVATTDIFIGNTIIFAYTWSAWSVMGFFGYALRKRQKKAVRHALELTGMGILGVLFFYTWTNFGVWHLGQMYPHTINGLVASYVAGIPFLKYQLISALIFVPSVSMVAIAAWNRLPLWLNARKDATVAATPYVRGQK